MKKLVLFLTFFSFVAASDSYLVDTDGTLWAGGTNSSGKLGAGDTTACSEFAKVKSSQ
ncbi:MAG: hypothetical protein LBQ52_09640 [Helicobacteraceae bacterium]|jgi:alpha-tubulin suppressor-like RCC1 family protein|nr:hypothetical protein [Helicobacteraceae bacterium]